MEQYLKQFTTHSAYDAVKNNLDKPNVVLCLLENEVHYNKIIVHDYVDLDLPSGTLWATMNVGAENPNEVGNKYDFTELDQAIQDWGEKGWTVPTKELYDELNRYKGLYGYFENNSSKELYFAPTLEREQLGIGYTASWSYWTSTEENQSKAYRESGEFYMTNNSYTIRTASVNKTFKGAVRLVKAQS